MPLDYETLRVIWWVLLGVLLIGFAIMDGFDLGVAMWLPWIAKSDIERRVIINTIAPTWEGNQVWFVLGGGAIFAAWPSLYALSFSGFYLAMLVVLLALILRPVGFKYRSKLPDLRWRGFWDYALFVSGFIPALIFGVAVGNVLQGVPFYFDESLRAFYTGSFWALLNPFAILCGLLSVLMLAMHGAYFLIVKTEAHLQKSAKKAAIICSVLTSLLFLIGGIWLYSGIDGYVLASAVAHDGASNPLHKTVIKMKGAWMQNFSSVPMMMLAPILGVCLPIFAAILIRFSRWAFCFSALAVGGIISTVGLSMFPFILPSSTFPRQSLLVWDSSSSQSTLLLMLVATVVFLPIILLYTAWVYRVLGGKVTPETILKNQESAY